jgi:hypothetical protein
MKKGLVFKGLGVWILCAALFCTGYAYGKTAISEDFRKKIEDTLERVEKDGPEAAQLVIDLKAGGASYMPELLAPVAPEKYQQEEKQRLITGIYLMDLTYAAVFDKNKDTAEYALAIYSLADKLGFPVPKMEKQIRETIAHIDAPDAQKRIEALTEAIEEDDSWKNMISSPKGIQFMSELLYGWMLEGIYISSELAAQANYRPNYLKVLSDHKSYVKTYMELLDQFIGMPELASTMRTEERLNTIKTLSGLLSGPDLLTKGQVEEIRKVAGEARSRIVK